jgi:DNA primase
MLEDTLFDTSLALPDMYIPFEKGKMCPKKPLEYLQERGIGWDIIEKYNIGYTSYNPNHRDISNRIILPSHNADGKINYWTGRDYSGYCKNQKYFNPKVERKNIIFDEDKIQWDADITLVEGPFDHIVVPNSIPLLGKSLKNDFYLYQKLVLSANANINIFLDNDAKNDALTVYKLLNQGRLYNKIRYICADSGKDPSDIYRERGKKGIIENLRKATKINEVFL